MVIKLMLALEGDLKKEIVSRKFFIFLENDLF